MKSLAIAASLMLAAIAGAQTVPTTVPADLTNMPWKLDEGGVVRGDVTKKQIALIFTGGDFGEGAPHILDTLKSHKIQASFFVTGAFLQKPEHQDSLKRIVAEGHYLGPHSDTHPLYCPWEDRKKTLVTEDFFREDVQKNINALRSDYAALNDKKPVYFIPPYEWYNADQVNWARPMNVLLFNYSPGSGSNRDWAPETEKSFVPSQKIIDDILAYEKKDPHGLNGFLLLLHIGSQRKDKTFLLLDSLLKSLEAQGYGFVRIDQMLALP